MTSPAHYHQAHTHHSQHRNQPENAQSGASSLAHVNPNSNPSTPTTHGALLNGHGGPVLSDAKQRARTVMAAAVIQPDPVRGLESSPANGFGSQGRKRSRSGSQLDTDRTPHNAVQNGTVVQVDDENEKTLYRYVDRDMLHAAALNDQIERSRDLFRRKEQERHFYATDGAQIRRDHPGAVFGYGYNGYGNGRTDQRTQLQYPMHRKRAGNRRTPELRMPRALIRQQAECHEELVPMRLDIELDKLRLRDTFTWNLNDRHIPLQQFADLLVEDLKLPLETSQSLSRQVYQELLEQINDHYPPIWPTGEAAEPLLPYWAHKNDDMRITVQLNITVGHITLLDQFEWDINDPNNSPEDFAQQMAHDLSLSGEFTTAIAHSIREQMQLYIKGLYLTNYEFDGRPIEDPDLRDNLMPSPPSSVFRAVQSLKDWSPFLFEINEGDLEKNDLAMLREQRAQKRQLNRRGGPALPDLRQRPRTIRSLIMSTVIPGAAEMMEATGIIKPPRVRSNRGRRRVTIDDGGSESDEDLEDSGSDSEPVAGTARTRGMRGAASAATVAMRHSYRSTTPDVLLATSDTRPVVVDPSRESHIVVLKLDPIKFKQWLARRRFGRTGAPPLSGFPTSIIARPLPAPAPSGPTKQALAPDPSDGETLPNDDTVMAEDKPIPAYQYDELGRVQVSATPRSEDDKVRFPKR